MKRLLLLAMSLAVVLASHAQTKDEDRQFKEMVKRARSLKLRNCEMNDGTKGWTLPNREPMGKLPVYRCTAEDAFGDR